MQRVSRANESSNSGRWIPLSHDSLSSDLQRKRPGPLPVSPTCARDPHPSRKSDGVFLWVRDLAISAMASILIITFLYQPVRVEGTSMLPRLEDQRPALHQQIRLSRLCHRARRRRRLSLSARSREKLHQTRDCSARRPDSHRSRPSLLNGQLLHEPYVPAMIPRRSLHGRNDRARRSYFMMGDHRSISSDSRDFGPLNAPSSMAKPCLSTGPLATSAWFIKAPAFMLAARRQRMPRRIGTAKPAKID